MTMQEFVANVDRSLRQARQSPDFVGTFEETQADGSFQTRIVINARRRPDGVWEMAQE